MKIQMKKNSGTQDHSASKTCTKTGPPNHPAHPWAWESNQGNFLTVSQMSQGWKPHKSQGEGEDILPELDDATESCLKSIKHH